MTLVKKLGEGGAPDVRHVAVGEAERRSAERAVVDNMKDAYVSVLAPSLLGVGISAEDSVLTHEDGVQHGAPLATTSFRVAIHPEVEECDKTLEDTDGAAKRFKPTMDIWWACRNTFGRPFTPPARPTMKVQSVGLEERFDKMYAYNADMEAAQCEAPADIEWPELDGHHCMPVLNVPLGSPGYVHAYMRGKAEELQEEVEASLSKLLYGNPSRRYAAAVREAWGRLVGHLSDADARVMEREAEAASGLRSSWRHF
eukprot:jgi/Tetstr1/425557/TSEL_015980.t1